MRWCFLGVIGLFACEDRRPLVLIRHCPEDAQCSEHGDCADDEFCDVDCRCRHSEFNEEQVRCGDGYCGDDEEAWNCPEDCGCQAGRESCDCGVAPGGCFCGWGCVEAGDCCPDVCESCGACGTDFLPRRGCGDGRCDPDEHCASCTRDCGECDGICPLPAAFIRYHTADGNAAFGLTLFAMFVTDYGVGDWERIREIPGDLSSMSISIVITVPSRAKSLELWASYRWTPNGRPRSSCEGELGAARTFGEFSVVTSGIVLTYTLAEGAPEALGTCSHSFLFQFIE